MEEHTGAQHDSWAWLENQEWEWLPPNLKLRIKGRLLVACSDVCARNLQPGDTRAAFCSEAFHVICEELSTGGLLTEQLLMSNSIMELVAAAEHTFWPRLQAITPATRMRPSILRRLRYWEGNLILASSSPPGRKGSKLQGRAGPARIDKRRLPRPDDGMEQTKFLIRELRAEGLSHLEICRRLGSRPRPPHAAWRDLTWPDAFMKYPNPVRAWISKVVRAD